MEYINSTASRQLTPAENMRALERAVQEADIRISIRKAKHVNARLAIGLSVAFPLSLYFMYHTVAPTGVMQNHKASSGAYMNFMQTFMQKPRSITETYRPEIAMKQQASALNDYTRRVEKQRQEGALASSVHHPTSWL